MIHLVKEVQLRLIKQWFQSMKETILKRTEIIILLHMSIHNSSSSWSFFQQVAVICLFPKTEDTQKDSFTIRSLNFYFFLFIIKYESNSGLTQGMEKGLAYVTLDHLNHLTAQLLENISLWIISTQTMYTIYYNHSLKLFHGRKCK